MFGHLKAPEFINLIEGAAIPSTRRTHLDACSRCFATWKSMEAAHEDFARIKTDVVEPEWAEFRSSVRDALLSRSAQRASIVRRWTGWPVRPVMAWTMSVVMVFGITAGALLWQRQADRTGTPAETVQQPVAAEASQDAAVDAIVDAVIGIDAEMTVWSQTSVFEELSELRTTEEESLRSLLMEADSGASER